MSDCSEAHLMSWARQKGGCPLPKIDPNHPEYKGKYEKCHTGRCQAQTSACAKNLVDEYNKQYCHEPTSPGMSAGGDVVLGLCRPANDSKGWCGPGPEYYSADASVCGNQADYNQAFRNALKYNRKQNIKQSKPWIWVYMAIYLIFFVWALSLASRVQPGPYRTMHMTLALVFSPIYVLAHYLGMLGK